MSKKEDKPQGDGKEITSDYAEKAVADLARLLAREQIKQHQPIVTIGLPTTLASIVTSIAFAMVYHQAGAFGGDAAIAGLGIALRLLTLGSLPLLGFTLGAQPAISFAWGAGNADRVLTAIRFTLLATSAFAIAYGLAMILFAPSIARSFTADPAVQTPAVDAIVAIHAAFLLIAPRMVVLALLQAMGQARRAALVSLAPQGYLLIPLLFVLPPWFGLDGIVASLVVAAVLTSILAIALLIPILRDLRHGGLHHGADAVARRACAGRQAALQRYAHVASGHLATAAAQTARPSAALISGPETGKTAAEKTISPSVTAARFERATYCLGNSCSIQLSYAVDEASSL